MRKISSFYCAALENAKRTRLRYHDFHAFPMPAEEIFEWQVQEFLISFKSLLKPAKRAESFIKKNANSEFRA
jgi:hypothetical protein